jgi:tetratricopeptide (TPR) repeat protein
MFRLVSLMIAVALAAAPARARAQTADSPARQAFEEGRRAYNMGHFSQAIAAFEASYRLSGDPVLLFNLAQAHRQAGQLDLSLNAYRAYLRERPDALNRTYVETKISELQARALAASSGQITALRPPGAAASAADISDPYARVEASRATPAPAAPLPRWLPWAAGMATVGLATAAVATTWSVRSRLDDLEERCAPPRGSGCPAGDVDRLESRALFRNLLWAATGVSAAATGVAFFWNPKERQVELSMRVRF